VSAQANTHQLRVLQPRWYDGGANPRASEQAERVTSASCDAEMSTSTLAAGCTISKSFMMVAPSLEIVTRPCAPERKTQSVLAWDAGARTSQQAGRWKACQHWNFLQQPE